MFFSAPSSGKSTKLSVKDQTSKSTNATFFGAVIPRGFNLAAGTALLGRNNLRRAGVNLTDNVSITGVGQTLPGSIPTDGPNTIGGSINIVTGGSFVEGDDVPPVGGAGLDGESSIWGYDASTQQMGLTWINYDGSSVDTTPYYNPDSITGAASLDMVSDTQSYLKTNPQAVEINMNFMA